MSYVTALPAMLASAPGECKASALTRRISGQRTRAPWIPAGDRIPAGDGWGTSRSTSDR